MQCQIVASPTDIPNFNAVETRSALILEANQRVLILDDVNGQWGLPGGVIVNGEEPKATMTRLFKEQVSTEGSSEKIKYLGIRYVRTDRDFLTHFYFGQLNEIPSALQTKGKWISIFALPLLPTLEGRQEALDIVYKERIWQRVEDKESKAAIVFRKNGQTLIFDQHRRFVIGLFGLPYSGKSTQAEKISKVYGLPKISEKPIMLSHLQPNVSQFGVAVNLYIKHRKQLNLPVEFINGAIFTKLGDCQAGCIFEGFPTTKEERKTIFSWIRHIDCHIPFFLKVSEALSKQRFDNDKPNAEEEVQKVYEFNVTKLKDNQQGIINDLGSQLIELELENKNSDEVFHLLSELIQKQFDQLAIQEITPPSPIKEGQVISHPGRRFQFPLFFGTAIVSFVLGGLLFKKIPFTYIGPFTRSSNS